MEMKRSNGCATGKLLEYLYLQKLHKLTGIDLSRLTNTTISRQINLIGKLEKDNGETMFLSLKNSKILLQFFF